MKIRTGFVSNSSSSSFCIYGLRLEEDDVNTLLKKYKVEDVYDLELPNLGIYGDSDIGYYIGREWSSIEDNETGKQFKNSVKEEIKNLDLKIKGLDTVEEVMYS